MNKDNIPSSVDQVDWETWEPTERAVLCFIVEKDNVLLIHKKTGLGKGKINGPGGRIEPGESAKEAAIRELEEEVGLTPLDPEKRGELSFIFTDGYSLHGTVFTATRYTGELTETREADPFWVSLERLPLDEMWQDDKYWLPDLLQGYHVRAHFIFDDDEMLSSEVFIFDGAE